MRNVHAGMGQCRIDRIVRKLIRHEPRVHERSKEVCRLDQSPVRPALLEDPRRLLLVNDRQCALRICYSVCNGRRFTVVQRSDKAPGREFVEDWSRITLQANHLSPAVTHPCAELGCMVTSVNRVSPNFTIGTSLHYYMPRHHREDLTRHSRAQDIDSHAGIKHQGVNLINQAGFQRCPPLLFRRHPRSFFEQPRGPDQAFVKLVLQIAVPG